MKKGVPSLINASLSQTRRRSFPKLGFLSKPSSIPISLGMMSDNKRLPSRYDSDGEITPPSNAVAPESSNMSRIRNKRKATHANYSGPSPKMIWSENDELSILKGIVEYRNERGVDYVSDSVAFFNYLKKCMESSNFSKDQLMCKIRRLKTKFRDNSAKKNPTFNKSHDSEIFNLSMAIWGKEKADCVVDGNITKTEVQGVVQHEEATNGEPEEDDDDDDSCDIKHMDKETGVKENEEGNAEDEICTLENAFEASMFQHSSKYAERMMLRNLRNLRGEERKALSDEWKALLVQEMQLKSKKLRFAGKLASAALE